MFGDFITMGQREYSEPVQFEATNLNGVQIQYDPESLEMGHAFVQFSTNEKKLPYSFTLGEITYELSSNSERVIEGEKPLVEIVLQPRDIVKLYYALSAMVRDLGISSNEQTIADIESETGFRP